MAPLKWVEPRLLDDPEFIRAFEAELRKRAKVTEKLCADLERSMRLTGRDLTLMVY